MVLPYARLVRGRTEGNERMPRAKSVAADPASPVVINVQQPQQTEEREKESRKLDDVDFWTYMRGLSPQQWRDHTLYLYRTKPVVGVNQREKYLAVYQQPFTIDDIKKAYGGEEFHAILNCGNRIVKHSTFAIEAAPIYDAARETPRQADANAAMVERLVDRTLNAQAHAHSSAAVDEVVDMMSKGFDATLERIGKTASGADGGDTMKLVLAMMQSQTQVMTTLIASLVKDRTAGADPKSTLKDTLELFAALKEFAGENGGGRRGSFFENLAERAVDKAPELIREIRGGVESIGRQRMELERVRQGGPGTAAPPAAPPVMAGPPAPAPAAPAPYVANPAPAPPQISENEAFEQLSARHIVKLIFAGEPVDLVMQFLRGANQKMYNSVLELNAQELRAVITADPILAQLLQYPELDAVLEEIVQYSGEEKAAMQAESDQQAAHQVQ